MTISELIKQLEVFKEKHGNIEVVVLDEWGSRPATEVDFQTYHDEQTRTWLPGVLIS
jgi:hypothetical protein